LNESTDNSSGGNTIETNLMRVSKVSNDSNKGLKDSKIISSQLSSGSLVKKAKISLRDVPRG
jgi:hypothetical protein